MRHLILGNGPAGSSPPRRCASTRPAIRDFAGRRARPAYSRMAIPTSHGRHRGAGNVAAQGAGHFERLGIELKTGRAAAVDTGKRVVRLESGESLPWDRLLVATGSTPTAADPGIDLPGVHPAGPWPTRARSPRARRKAAACCRWARASSAASSWRRWPPAVRPRGRGDGRPDGAAHDAAQGERAHPRLVRARGIRVVTGARVAEIRQAGKALSVVLTDGQSFTADLVVSARA